MTRISSQDDPPDEGPVTKPVSPEAATLHKVRRGYLTNPRILFPTIAVLVLALIWGTTLTFVKAERAATVSGAQLLSREQAETYEAQVIRALREINQTLEMIQYVYESTGEHDKLDDLNARGLLPPDLLFTVSIADGNGDVVASTRPADMRNVANQDYFKAQRSTDTFWVGAPRKIPPSDEWQLQFSRRLVAPDGHFSGVAMVAVDAAYFVSGYESAKLGNHGMLGILGTDGLFRVLRSGETVSAGERVDYASVVPASNDAQENALLSTNVWDGIKRYTTVRELYDFPLTVIVGLSESEQLAAFRHNRLIYLWRAAAASILLLVIIAILERLSRQLAASRQREVDEQVAHAARVEYLAYHDGLTKLPNRSLFSKLLSQSVRQAHRHNRQLAVLFFDLDYFKNVNDTLGHEAGDDLLREMAIRLNGCMRESDTVARIGGDEFVALLPELSDDKYVATVAQKILSAVARPFTLQGQEFRVTASIGISVYPQDGLDERTLERNADVAMYQVKENGRNNFQFYSEDLNANSLERRALESSMRNALDRNEFRLHYQAVRNVTSGKISGVEALLRWEHPDLGIVEPMRFIPIAEESGLILSIGKWVLRTACMQNVAWRRQGFPPLSMAVNLTTGQFYDEGLAEILTTTFAETGMDPHMLELEITETLLLHDVNKALRILNELTRMGVRLAIDNFGLGFASLFLLKQLPIDAIKIDRSLIHDITSNPVSRGQTEAIIALGRTLGQTTVAQGVENKAQVDYLSKNSCDEFQGFYLNPPVPADQFAQLLRTELDNAPADAKPAY